VRLSPFEQLHVDRHRLLRIGVEGLPPCLELVRDFDISFT
jgi:hypothetical protein